MGEEGRCDRCCLGASCVSFALFEQESFALPDRLTFNGNLRGFSVDVRR